MRQREEIVSHTEHDVPVDPDAAHDGQFAPKFGTDPGRIEIGNSWRMTTGTGIPPSGVDVPDGMRAGFMYCAYGESTRTHIHVADDSVEGLPLEGNPAGTAVIVAGSKPPLPPLAAGKGADDVELPTNWRGVDSTSHCGMGSQFGVALREVGTKFVLLLPAASEGRTVNGPDADHESIAFDFFL